MGRHLPWVLFGLVLGRHVGVDWLAQLFPDPAFSRKALFYAAGGVMGAVLLGLVWHMTPWNPPERRVSVALVCSWGILEEAQVAVGRILLGLDKPVGPLDPWRGIVDQLSGLPISTMTLTVPACIVYWLAHNNLGTKWPNRLPPQ